MEEGILRGVKSSQEQAVAAWITHLNQLRLDELMVRLDQQDINLEEALAELAELKDFIGDPSHILGSLKTKHGEIAEHVQVNFSNAENLIKGLKREYTFEGVGRTAPADYLKNGQQIQSKFCNGAKKTLAAVQKHLETYPDFVKNGSSYDIPRDQYELITKLLKSAESNPSSLSKEDWGIVNAARKFEQETGLNIFKDLNPATVDYDAVQQGVINDTIAKEEESIKQEDQKQRNDAYDNSKPSLKEGIKAAGASAAIEGGVTFCMAVAAKRKEGKKLSEFTEKDWKDIGIESGKGTLKGGIRGGSIYLLTNFTATPANVASAYVTAAFGIAAQARALEQGKVSQEDFVINCETVCLDVTVSAIASLAGQALIPIPVLGAVIGNVVGEFSYELCKKYGAKKSQKIISGYHDDMERLKLQLDLQFYKVLSEIQDAMKRFADLESLAFSPDVNEAFEASCKLALEVGVEKAKVLKDMSDIDTYFGL